MNDKLIRKKDGSLEEFDPNKIIIAVNKSAKRVMVEFDEKEWNHLIELIDNYLIKEEEEVIDITKMHLIVEKALVQINKEVADSYKEYRNYKTDFVKMLDDVYKRSQDIMAIGDKENANMDSALVSTKRTLIFNELNKSLYKKFFLNQEELQAVNDGYIYIHDMCARRDTMNCCLFDVANVLTGGFEMGNIWYNEPKTLTTAMEVIADIVLTAAGQQYGGFTIPECDKLLAPYGKKSYERYIDEYLSLGVELSKAEAKAIEKVENDFMQGFQGWEYKFNTVASSRGDYPFITVTFGLGEEFFAQMASKCILRVRRGGQGKKGFKKPVLFPKLVFLYDKKLHDENGKLNDVFEEGIKCSAKTMYPDWLSLSGKGYVASMYQKYHEVVSPMGCRAFLSPYYEKGGMKPLDENDKPYFVGRFNIGAISLNLPMILAKAQEKHTNFYDELDYYLNLIRKLHQKTYDYLSNMRASTNPLAYCEGGFHGGNLKPTDKIAPLLKQSTASFGITALNELQKLYNQKSLVEDGDFALEVMEYINKKIAEFKEEDGILYAIYGTPAENLCGVQIQQFRKKYGIVEGVSDREYVSNSFHCHVSEDISPIEKQDLEERFWDYFNGGKIQYVRYPLSYNLSAIRTLVKRAMDKGFYEGVNLALSYCDDCGHEELDMDVCPVCGSTNLTKIDRMNGYLSYSRVKGDTRLNAAKMAELKERRSM